MNISSDPSFLNFLWDVFVSSSSCKEIFYQNEDCFNLNEKSLLLNDYLENSHLWKKIYKERISFLKNNISLQFRDKKNLVDNVYYHPRFGWVVCSKGHKAFLGKINILENVKINVGIRTYFSGNGTIRGNSSVNIGSYSAIAEGCFINSSNDSHPMDYPSLFGFKTERRLREDNMLLPLKHKSLSQKKTDITIGNDVWICRNARILNGVIIGDGCVIAENSFVNKDCEPYGVYAGLPAKLIKYRFSEQIIEQLLEIKWWNWSYQKIKDNTKFFDTDLRLYKGNLQDLII